GQHLGRVVAGDRDRGQRGGLRRGLGAAAQLVGVTQPDEEESQRQQGQRQADEQEQVGLSALVSRKRSETEPHEDQGQRPRPPVPVPSPPPSRICVIVATRLFAIWLPRSLANTAAAIAATSTMTAAYSTKPPPRSSRWRSRSA